MIAAESFIQAAKAKGFEFYTGVPCSYLKSFINAVIDSPDLHYVGAANEGDAVAICSATLARTPLGCNWQESVVSPCSKILVLAMP